MKLYSAFVVVTGLAFVQAASAADITGKVTLNGTPPAEREITPVMEKDPACGKLHTEKVTTHFYVVGPNKELADTIVMLKGVPAKAADAAVAPAVLDQKGCMYVPQILAVQTGQKLLVKTSDPLPVPMHNVHLTPLVGANADANRAKLNMPQGPGAPDITYTFPAGENFLKFQCDVHNWMLAWVTVVDNPYFAVTGKDGKFTIKNVPPGKYKIVALHRKAAPTGMDKEVEVKDSGATVDFTLEVPPAAK